MYIWTYTGVRAHKGTHCTLTDSSNELALYSATNHLPLRLQLVAG
jgi:hypothetical protein